MTNALMVAKKDPQGTWPVYKMEDIIRKEGEAVPLPGPPVGSVSSWAELNDLADKYGVEKHQIYGDGRDEMEGELGPMPQ
jgi:hypothetical protein